MKDYVENKDFLSKSLSKICQEAENAANRGYAYLILSDRMAGISI